MPKRRRRAKHSQPETPKDETPASSKFRDVVRRHLAGLGWNAEDLCAASEKYPAEFSHSISRSYLYALLSESSGSEARATRGMCNLIAHTLTAHYEAQNGGSPAREFNRRNLEILLYELLEAAGYAPLSSDADDWDKIMGNRTPDQAPPVRIGYFKFGYFTGNKFDPASPSRELMKQLLRVLGLRGEQIFVPVKLEELYSETLFRKVDLLAPLMSVPARRYTVATSEDVGDWTVGQNVVCAAQFRSQLSALPDCTTFSTLLEPREFWTALEIHTVKGGITEMVLDFLELPAHQVKHHLDFEEAVDQAIVLPPQKLSDGAKIPALLCDDLTATWVEKERGGELLFTKGEITPRPLAIGLPPRRPEVAAMVNDGLAMLETLGLIDKISEGCNLKGLGITPAPPEKRKQ